MRNNLVLRALGVGAVVALFAPAAQAQNPPAVQFTAGYPAINQPIGFMWIGRVDVLGTYQNQVAGLGTATNAAFIYVPQQGGTVNTISLDRQNGTFGAAVGNGIGPKQVAVPVGKWNCYVMVLYARPNPDFNPNVPGSPPALFTPVQTNVVAFEIK